MNNATQVENVKEARGQFDSWFEDEVLGKRLPEKLGKSPEKFSEIANGPYGREFRQYLLGLKALFEKINMFCRHTDETDFADFELDLIGRELLELMFQSRNQIVTLEYGFEQNGPDGYIEKLGANQLLPLINMINNLWIERQIRNQEIDEVSLRQHGRVLRIVER